MGRGGERETFSLFIHPTITRKSTINLNIYTNKIQIQALVFLIGRIQLFLSPRLQCRRGRIFK